MEQLFRLTELEIRVPLNLNVLDPLGVPRVMNLKEALQAFLDHRRVVLQRAQPPPPRGGRPPHGDPARPDHRLCQSRRGDPHHPRRRRPEGRDDGPLGADRGAGRGDPEHAAARLAPARGDRDPQGARRARRPRRRKLTALLASEQRQWRAIAKEVSETAAEFGGDTPLGRRRTEIAAAPAPIEIPAEALVEREPVTVLCSAKGWIRAVKGHNVSAAEQKYKEGDAPRFAVAAETTDRLIVFGTNGRFYTIGVDRLPGGRGHGEPLRLMIDLPNEHDIVAMFPYRPGMELLVVGERRARLCRRRRGGGRADPRRQAGADAGRGRRRPDLRCRPRPATRSPLSATTARC